MSVWDTTLNNGKVPEYVIAEYFIAIAPSGHTWKDLIYWSNRTDIKTTWKQMTYAKLNCIE